MVSIAVRGHNRVANNLRAVAAQAPRNFDRVLYRHMQDWRAELKSKAYPPRRPKQTYIRTGRLANSWGVRTKSNGVYSIYNSSPYAKYVVDAVDQAWMHKGRWWTIREFMAERDRRRDLTAALTKELETLLNE